jgi:hypothetical protein
MSSFKSGVVHDEIAVSDKETALAMIDTIKKNSGLFEDAVKDKFKAPHFCVYRPVVDGLLSSITGLNRAITSFKAADSKGVQHRHFLGMCECGKTKIASERL